MKTKALLLSLMFVASVGVACDFDHLTDFVPSEKIAAVELEIHNANLYYDQCITAVESSIAPVTYEQCDMDFEIMLDTIAEKYEIILPEVID